MRAALAPSFAALVAALLALTAGQARAQAFMTPEEVKPILQMTRANWVAIGATGANDLFYFTHIAAMRCGFDSASYRLNGGTDEIGIDFEPCYRDTAQPNAIQGLPFVIYPPDSIASVIVTLKFPDGTTETAKYERRDILLP
jgi:hypothetical protein